MQVVVFEKQVETTPVLRLALRACQNGVALIAVDERGNPLECGYILTVGVHGMIVRHPDVNKDTGLQLDSGGYVKMAE